MLSVTLASAEPDTDASDNSAQGSVRVNTPGGGSAGGGEDEGGGSAGWLLLTLLAGLSTRRALRIRRQAG